MTVLQVQTDRERRIADELRLRALPIIEELGPECVAERLALLPSGVRSLQARENWTLETAFRVAEALAIEVTLSVEDRLRASV